MSKGTKNKFESIKKLYQILPILNYKIENYLLLLKRTLGDYELNCSWTYESNL